MDRLALFADALTKQQADVDQLKAELVSARAEAAALKLGLGAKVSLLQDAVRSLHGAESCRA